MIYYKKQEITNFNELVSKYILNEFKSPYRSTIPLLLLYKNRPNYFFNLIVQNDAALVDLIFEYETKVRKVEGRPSGTDLMINHPSVSIAIEAKRTEPQYEKVNSWLDESKNRKDVLNGWLEYINEYILEQISIRDILELPYQLVHRVASACSIKKKCTNVVYVGFDLNDAKKEYYKNNLNKFSKLLKRKINILFASFKINKSEEQIKLESEWEQGDRDLSVEIKNGIINNNLMSFIEEEVTLV